MPTRLVVLFCLAAGCAAPPGVRTGPELSASDPTGQTTSPGGTASPAVHRQPPRTSWTLRVGVEYLPPGTGEELPRRSETEQPRAEPRVDPMRAVAPPKVAVEKPGRLPAAGSADRILFDRKERLLWDLDESRLREIRNPVERATVRFIHDLMGEDRRRIKWRIGTPILTSRHEDPQMPFLPTHIDEKDADEEAEFLGDEARRLLRRPLRKAIKKTALVESLEVALDEFKAANLPTSGAWQESHPGKVKWGRVSMRWRVHDGSDPLELRYLINGWRIAASKERLKAGFQTWLADDLSLELRTGYDLNRTDWSVRTDLVYYLNESTRLQCVAGDNLDFLATSNLYSLFESPMDGSPGVLLFAVHLF